MGNSKPSFPIRANLNLLGQTGNPSRSEFTLDPGDAFPAWSFQRAVTLPNRTPAIASSVISSVKIKGGRKVSLNRDKRNAINRGSAARPAAFVDHTAVDVLTIRNDRQFLLCHHNYTCHQLTLVAVERDSRRGATVSLKKQPRRRCLICPNARHLFLLCDG